jgi:ketosteroid isomerase-like protein
MRIMLYWFLILALAAGDAQTAGVRDAQPSRIVALENAWNQAVQQKDVKAIEPLMSEELVSIDDDDTVMNKEQYLASLSTPGLHFEHIVSESMQVRLYGQSAVVIGVYREQGTKTGKRVFARERFVDTWINQNDAWICVGQPVDADCAGRLHPSRRALKLPFSQCFPSALPGLPMSCCCGR